MRGTHRLSISVIVGAYEAPEPLAAVLRAFRDQSDDGFSIVVAEDGSGPATRAVVEEFVPDFGDRIAHVRQPDEGYRLAASFDRGALAARGDYLVFLGGDCVPRRHFVRAFRAAARPGWFVAANRVLLSGELTERVLRDAMPIHRWSTLRLLFATRGGGAAYATLTPRDRRRVGNRGLPDFAPDNNAYCCVGVFARDFEAVNGYDTRFVGWGDEDVDLAVRLRRLGLRCGHAGRHAVPLHLWHESRLDPVRANWDRLKETEKSDRIEAVEGLRELRAELSEAQLSANRVGASSSSSAPEKP